MKRYFNAEIDDPALYDVALNTGRFSFESATDTIAQLALQRHCALVEPALLYNPGLAI